jgi:hypothetical protein
MAPSSQELEPPRFPGRFSKPSLGQIPKRGDAYLRTLLIQGAKASMIHAKKRSDRISMWMASLVDRIVWQKAVVAMANKNDRILWAVLTKGTAHDPNHVPINPGLPATA